MSEVKIKTADEVVLDDSQIPEIIEVIDRGPKPNNLKDAHPKWKRDKAKELYMEHHSYPEIAAALKIPAATIASWVSRFHWSSERNVSDERADENFHAAKKIKYDILSDLILDNAIKTVKNAAKSGKGFKPADFTKFVAMLPNLERTNRLNKGKATTITEERSKKASFTINTDHFKQLQNIKASDPFNDGSSNSGS